MGHQQHGRLEVPGIKPRILIKMGYEISLRLAWNELDNLGMQDRAVSFLGEHYQVRVSDRALLQSSGEPAGEMEAVLILHYLIGLLKHGYRPTGEWISFKETPGGKLFWPAFQESIIKPLVERFDKDPEGLARNLEDRLGGRRVEGGDVAVQLEAFPDIFVRMVFWKGDEELPAEASMLFDRGLNEIYCTEDVSVMLMAAAQRVME
jgi:hypothetical protein